MAFGRIKTKILNRSTQCLSGLVTGKQNLLKRSLFNSISTLWNLFTPSVLCKIVSERDYTKNYGSKEIYRVSNRKGSYANVVTYGRSDKQRLLERELPDVAVTLHHDVCLFHGSEHFANLRDKLVVNDYLAFKTDPNASYQDFATYSYANGVIVLKQWERKKSVKTGIMINGRFSFNYYHNIYENLILLLILRDINDRIPSDVPILVDEDIFKVFSFKKVYDYLTEGLNREVILTQRREMVEVKELYHISAVNPLVPCHISIADGLDQDYTFDKEYTLRFRELLLQHKEEGDYPKRFFITRKGTKHRKFNENEVFALLKPYGFVQLAPETLTFERQMALFNGAEWVIGGSGAAFTNLLFCNSDCHAIVLEKNYSHQPPIFIPPVCFNNAQIIYYTETTGVDVLEQNSGFTIDIDKFKEFVNHYIASRIEHNMK